MNIQEKFLIATKNAMFWNFSSHDITETLKDLKHNFQDARKNGSSDNEIINEYGSPKNVAESLKDEISGQKQKNAVYRRKMTLLILCIIAIFVSVFTLPVKLSSCTIIVIASVFYHNAKCFTYKFTFCLHWTSQKCRYLDYCN